MPRFTVVWQSELMKAPAFLYFDKARAAFAAAKRLGGYVYRRKKESGK